MFSFIVAEKCKRLNRSFRDIKQTTGELFLEYKIEYSVRIIYNYNEVNIVEQRQGNIIIHASGGTSGKGARTYKLTLPSSWAKQIGVTAVSYTHLDVYKRQIWGSLRFA